MAKKQRKFKESVGLDIGTHSIKIVHLKKIHDGFKLLNYEIRPTVPQDMEYTLSDLRKDRHAPVLSGMLKSLHLRGSSIKRLVSSIGGDNTSIKQIKTIFLPEDELESALFFEAKKHLPIAGGEMILDYQVLDIEERTNNMNILLVATNKQMLREHSDVLRAVNIQPNIVDVEPLAVANCFALNSSVEEGTYVLVNIGAHRTNLVIYGPKSKFFSRDFGWGGFNFTRDIMRKHNLEFAEAEKFKYEYGIHEPQTGQGKTLQMLDITEKPTQEQIAMEIKRSLRFYVKEAGNSDFHKIYLMGGGAKTKGIAEYIGEMLNIPTEVYNPFQNLEMPEKFRDKHDPQLGLALGLAMRPE